MTDEGKNITVSDLAREVGVSPATISRVLNHSHLVSKSTYDKVMKVIDRLGYEIPEQRESAIAKKPHGNVVVVNVFDYSDGAYAEYMKGVQTSAYRYDWVPVLTQDPLTEVTMENYIMTLSGMRAAGVLVLNHADKGVLERINAEFPVVQCGEYNEAANLPYVGIDDASAARAIVAHLIAGGARKIAFVNAPSRFRYARERRRGYEQALAAAGIELNPTHVIELSEPSYAMAHAFASPMLTFQNLPDAIFAANDVIAYAVISAAREQGLEIPRDLAVAGFENLEISIMSRPKITTVSQPRFQMGFIGCELLREQWANEAAPTQSIILNTELVVRGSTR
ncbi:MAG: LacI family transcriptional regulator [Clostridiales bacterium]|nr:LacI family transcriptional regulator [Clostridiales bacterium]